MYRTNRFWTNLMFLSSIFVITLSACRDTSTSPSLILGTEIPSIKIYMPKIYNAASQWDVDAYPILVSISFGSPEYISSDISVSFESPNKPNKELLIQLGPEDEINTLVNPSGYNSEEKEIVDSDWLLDSPEIINRVLDFPGTRDFLNSHLSHTCVRMILKHHFELNSNAKYLFWRVYFYDCQNIVDLIFVDVDPNTGEELIQYR